MNSVISNELNSIKQELTQIIAELDNISYGIRHDFSGIGNEKCSNSIDSVADSYRAIKIKLDNIKSSSDKGSR